MKFGETVLLRNVKKKNLAETARVMGKSEKEKALSVDKTFIGG